MSVAAGERRVVSVLVADVADSTAIAERLGPERSKFLFDEVVRLMSEEVHRYGGTVAQLTGDGVLALFGAPTAHEDDSARAVLAALGIQDAAERYAGEIIAAYGVELVARVAVNTGPVVIPAGEVTDEERYNALGDTVNIAARLQELAGHGGIVVGPTTAGQLRPHVELEPLGDIELKGKSAPVRTFRVTGVREPSPAVRESPLLGRERELEALERVFELLVEGRGAVVVVTGEPGIGKSRLIAEVRERFSYRVRFLEGIGVAYAESFPFWPIRDLLRSWLGLGISDAEARVRLELKAGLAQALGAGADAAYPLLGTVLGLSLEPDAAQRISDLSRESMQRATFDAVFDVVAALARERPLCLVLDDLHWADDSTLELLQELLPVTEEEAVALVLTYRSEREHGSWQLGEWSRRRYPHRYTELELSPLPEDASARLAASTADGELPNDVAALLAERAGGNPFFLQEALRDVLERGVLRREDNRLELAAPVDELEIPALVQEALQARLDRLADETREVIGIASVVGRSFGMPLLDQLLPRTQLVRALSELQRLDLVVEERRRPALEYRFRHGLVQEVAYSALTEARRREIHRQVGGALEQESSGEEVYGLLARHFSRADDPRRAADYLLKAGDAARRLYANEEAIEQYERALVFLDRLGDDERARQTLFKVALTHHLAFDFERANAAYGEAFARPSPPARRLEPTERFETLLVEPEAPPAPGHTYSSQGWMLVQNLFRGLLSIDGDLNVLPSLAEDFTLSGDGSSYTFRLRADARWNDGASVTAHDFVYAWRRTREQGLVTSVLLADVSSVEATDDRTLEVHVHEPRSYFPYVLALPATFPWPRHRVAELGERWLEAENLIGNGPFLLAESRNDRMLLTPNPYWSGNRGNIGAVAIEYWSGDRDALEAWGGGRYDVLRSGAPSDADDPASIGTPVPQLTTIYLGFRADRAPFDDERARKALMLAIDRERLYSHAPNRLHEPAIRGGIIPPAMPAHSGRQALEHDPAAARQLLAEAGYPGGRGFPDIEVTSPSGPDWKVWEDDLAAQCALLGVQMRVRRVSWSADPPPTADGFISGWIADYPDPSSVFSVVAAMPGLYTDAEIDELLERARSLRDPNERNRLYREADRLYVVERAALLPLHYVRDFVRRRPWVEGFWASPISACGLEEIVIRRELRP